MTNDMIEGEGTTAMDGQWNEMRTRNEYDASRSDLKNIPLTTLTACVREAR